MKKYIRFTGAMLDKTPYYIDRFNRISLAYLHIEDKKWLIEQLEADYNPAFHHDLCKAVWEYNTYNLPYMFPITWIYNIAYFRRSIYFWIHQKMVVEETLNEIFKKR